MLSSNSVMPVNAGFSPTLSLYSLVGIYALFTCHLANYSGRAAIKI